MTIKDLISLEKHNNMIDINKKSKAILPMHSISNNDYQFNHEINKVFNKSDN